MPILPTTRLPIAQRLIPFSFNGGGVPISPGVYGDLGLEWDGKLQKVILIGRPVPGDIEIDIWIGQPEDFPLTNANSMIGSGTKPALVNEQYAVFEDFSDWETTDIPDGSIITYSVESANLLDLVTVEMVVLSLAI